MKALTLIFLLVFTLLSGCEEKMTNIAEIERLKNASTSNEEGEILDGILELLRENNTPITVTVMENGSEIPVQKLGEKIESNLSVRISFDNGDSYNWKPLENNNIFLLLRE